MSKTCQVSVVQVTSKAWCSQCPMVCLGSAGKRRSCRRCQDRHTHSLRCERRRRRRRRNRNSGIAFFLNDCLLPQLKGWLHRRCKDQRCQADGAPTFPGRSEERERKRCKLYRQEMLVTCFFWGSECFLRVQTCRSQSPFVDLSTCSVFQAQPRLRRPHQKLRCLHQRRKPHEVGSF